MGIVGNVIPSPRIADNSDCTARTRIHCQRHHGFGRLLLTTNVALLESPLVGFVATSSAMHSTNSNTTHGLQFLIRSASFST